MTYSKSNCPLTTGTVLRLITSKSALSSPSDGSETQIGGARPPVPDFQAPFKEYSISELRAAFLEGIAGLTDTTEEGYWAKSCFAMLDQRFLEDGTVLLVTAELDEEGDCEILGRRCEAEVMLDLLLMYEAQGLGIEWHDADSEDWSLVVTAEEFNVMAGAYPKTQGSLTLD